MLNLIHKRRMDSLKLQIKNNGNIKRKMVNFWSGIEGEDNQDPEAVAQDNSNELQTQNDIINQFEKNAFDLFKSNQISAQRFITSVPESDYPDFNNIFHELKSIYFGQGNQLNSVLVLERAKRLIQDAKKIPSVSTGIPTSPPRLKVVKNFPLRTPPLSRTSSLKTPTKMLNLPQRSRGTSLPFNPVKSVSNEHTPVDASGRVECLICGSIVKLSGFPQHRNQQKHKNALVGQQPFGTFIQPNFSSVEV